MIIQIKSPLFTFFLISFSTSANDFGVVNEKNCLLFFLIIEKKLFPSRFVQNSFF